MAADLGRILSIDYGHKRVGLAITDELKISINPLPTIPADRLDDRLEELLETFCIEVVVIGVSYHADGSLTRTGRTVRSLMVRWRKKYGQIRFDEVDESWTSAEAQKILLQLGISKKKRAEKGIVDQVAAGIILKEYLNQTSK